MGRLRTRIAAAGGALGLAVLMAPAASAAEDSGAAAVNAAITGTAIASGAFVPFNVNPNVQIYPAYSFSETYNDSSHSLAGGVYPGFLVDAAAQFYGYGAEARGTLGIAESQWPNPPQKVDAGFTTFGDKCPFLSADFGFPDSFVETCKAYWAQWGDYFPAHTATASTSSANLLSKANAQGTGLITPGGVTVGTFETSSETKVAADGKTVTSTATVLLGRVQIGPIEIDSIRSVATATSGGTQQAAKSTRRLDIAGATFGSLRDPIIIDDNGVHSATQTGPAGDLNKQLSAYGFDIRTINGGSVAKADETATESGALVIQWSGNSPPQPLVAPSDALCNAQASARENESKQLKALTGKDQYQFGTTQQNPLRQENAASQTINPVTNKKLYDPNARPFTLADPTVGADATLPPVLPCLDFLLARSVNVGFALGSAFAEATYRLLRPVAAGFDDFVPFDGGSFSSSFTIPGFDGSITEPLAPASPAVNPVRIRRTTTAVLPSELAAGVADRVKLLYAVMTASVVMLLIGRRVLRVLIRL